MQSATQYIMRDQVRDLIPTLMKTKPGDRTDGFGMLRFAAFLGAVATYMAAVTLSA